MLAKEKPRHGEHPLPDLAGKVLVLLAIRVDAASL